MTDYIKRQDAIECVTAGAKPSTIRGRIAEIPPAPVREVVKGEWIPWEYAMPGHEYKFHKCSVCGVCDEYVTEVKRPNGTIGRLKAVRNFCPNCGADMRKEQP